MIYDSRDRLLGPGYRGKTVLDRPFAKPAYYYFCPLVGKTYRREICSFKLGAKQLFYT